MALRHESLVHLSRDHHDGLLLAQQILEQRRTMLPDWPKDFQGRVAYVVTFFQEHLRSHFKAEEEILFPLILRHIPTAKDLITDLLGDHRLMEVIVQGFSRKGFAPSQERLHEFGRTLEAHIRKEERKLFPLFEEQASEGVLSEAQAALSLGYPETKPRAQK